MEKTILQMDFLDEIGKTFRISVENPLEDLAQSEVEAAMDSIITRNCFISNGTDLVSKKGARIITTYLNELVFN